MCNNIITLRNIGVVCGWRAGLNALICAQHVFAVVFRMVLDVNVDDDDSPLRYIVGTRSQAHHRVDRTCSSDKRTQSSRWEMRIAIFGVMSHRILCDVDASMGSDHHHIHTPPTKGRGGVLNPDVWCNFQGVFASRYLFYAGFNLVIEHICNFKF